MSTIGYESWAVDLADVGAVYPFQGLELPMVIIGVALWLSWHVIQSKRETADIEEAMKVSDPDKIAKMLDKY